MSDLEYLGRLLGGLLLLGIVGAVLFIGGAWLASMARAAWRELRRDAAEARQQWATLHFIRMIRKGRGEGGQV